MLGRGRGAYYKTKYGGGRSRELREASQLSVAESSIGGGGPIRPPTRSARQFGNAGFQDPEIRTYETLHNTLVLLENASYGAYKRIEGRFQFPTFTLFIDHVQSDPYAPPSRIRIRVPQTFAAFPPDLCNPRIRNVALADYLTRMIWDYVHSQGLDIREAGGGWSGQKGGEFNIDKPGQQVLQRNSVVVRRDCIEMRCTVTLPGKGRSILGRWAAQILTEHLPRLVSSTLVHAALNTAHLRKHIESVEDQESLRGQLKGCGLLAFVCNGAILPRASGASDLPMSGNGVVPFSSPPSMEVEFTLPNAGQVKGMGLPRGVVLITGGGFHGKSTLLKALELGVYNHIPGDGREFVCTDSGVVKIRAEDGRSVTCTDITPFINNLPICKDTQRFSTEDASGSTSMAANIQEALEVGATGFLYDEDTCATNFLIRDKRMQRLITKQYEPITPLIYKIRRMASELGVSTTMVMGGCGDYLDFADVVLEMRCYLPRDATEEAKKIARDFPSNLVDEGGSTYGTITHRIPVLPLPQGKHPIAKTLHHILYYNTDLSLLALDQLVSSSQTRCIADAMTFVQREFPGRTMRELVDALETVFDEDGTDDEAGLGKVHPEGWAVGWYARPRRFEIAAAISRLRGVSMRQVGDIVS